MKKTVIPALLFAANLGLAACDKKGEDKAVALAAPATKTRLSVPATPLAEPSVPAPSGNASITPQTLAPTSEQPQ